MEPSKRICLKNLPENCTKQEIAEFVRNRTATQPHSIDLGLDGEGHTRRYAHFSCERAKQVLQMLADGALMRDSLVHAYAAKAHYSFRYAEARRKREREEAEHAKASQEYWDAVKERFLRRSRGGELPTRPPRHYCATQRRYAVIASELADRLRREHAAHRPAQRPQEVQLRPSQPSSAPVVQPASPPTPHKPSAQAASSPSFASSLTTKKVERTPAPVVQPRQVSKEERKLSGLQAKLAALKAKMTQV